MNISTEKLKCEVIKGKELLRSKIITGGQTTEQGHSNILATQYLI
jgi:hypothetical protein